MDHRDRRCGVPLRKIRSQPHRPLISIAIPAHNEEGYIAGCLRSLAHQRTGAELEIIICLNACTDRTEEVVTGAIRHFNNISFKLVSEPIGGVGRARQRAFEQAQGEIIFSADADTWYPPDWVERFLAIFQRDPKVVLVYGPVRFQLAGLRRGTKLLLQYLYPLLDLLATGFGLLAGRPNVCGANFAVRREAFNRVGGFDVSLKIFEDNELARRLSRIGRIHYDPQAVVYTSGRRYSRYGFARTVAYYTFNYILMCYRRPGPEFQIHGT